MAQISEIRKELYEMASQWEEESRRDPRDYFSFQGLLDEIFFHADLRFKDYIQYQSEGEFPIRLKKWLDNISEARGKKTLLFLLSLFIFIDRSQLLSLYRDAYRRVIVPFISQEVFSSNDFLSIDYECRVFSLLKEYRLFSITQSFDNLNFIHANDLTGLPKPVILGEDKSKVAVMLPCQDNNLRGLIIFEDFVGTGKQAKEVLIEVKRNIQSEWRLLFVPLIVLERGLKTLKDEPALSEVTIEPVLIIRDVSCLRDHTMAGEPPEFGRIRAIVKSTASKVLESFGEHDDPPSDPFGYKGSGALIVTSHNTPNNTLPLLHHRAPDWFPLFRRIHHSKDGL